MFFGRRWWKISMQIMWSRKSWRSVKGDSGAENENSSPEFEEIHLWETHSSQIQITIWWRYMFSLSSQCSLCLNFLMCYCCREWSLRRRNRRLGGLQIWTNVIFRKVNIYIYISENADVHLCLYLWMEVWWFVYIMFNVNIICGYNWYALSLWLRRT